MVTHRQPMGKLADEKNRRNG